MGFHASFHKAPPFFASSWSWTHPDTQPDEEDGILGYEVAAPPADVVETFSPSIGWPGASAPISRVSAFRGISLISVLMMTVFLVAFLVARTLLRRFRVPLPRSSTFELYHKRRSSSIRAELLPSHSVNLTPWDIPDVDTPLSNVVLCSEDEDTEEYTHQSSACCFHTQSFERNRLRIL